MIKNIRYNHTIYSRLKYPSAKGLMEGLIDCNDKPTKEGDTLKLYIKITYLLKQYDGSKTYSIFKSYTDCEVITDGRLTALELYEPYRRSMTNLINVLQVVEKQKGLQPTTFLQPIPFKSFEEKLQAFVDYYFKN